MFQLRSLKLELRTQTSMFDVPPPPPSPRQPPTVFSFFFRFFSHAKFRTSTGDSRSLTLFAPGCDLQGRKTNFTNPKTLVDAATDRDARYFRPAQMLRTFEKKTKNEKKRKKKQWKNEKINIFKKLTYLGRSQPCHARSCN